ncbi:MAG: 30S ribosomal protein S9 [Candidatus Babeliaceae bacterium]|nr:30S ribosomal protein S9 [Candidatus Babeliaceae bacterium]
MKTTTKPLSKSSTPKTASVSTKVATQTKTAAEKRAPAARKKTNAPVSHAVGRRKSSVARVWLRTGKGAFTVNGKEVLSYFDTEVSRASALAPWTMLPHLSKEFDIEVNVNGGGMNSQADAVKLGVARAVIEVRNDARDVLRSEGLLTVDSRIKERKKYGQKGARRKFQFVKR